MFCYHSAWHLRDLAVKEHALDWSPWPLLASGTCFSVLAHIALIALYAVIFRLLLLSSCGFFPWLVLSRHETFLRKARYFSEWSRSTQLATESNSVENLTSSPTALLALANTRLDCDQGKSAWLAQMEGRQYQWLKGIQHNVSTVRIGKDRGKRFCPNSYLMSLFPFPLFTW